MAGHPPGGAGRARRAGARGFTLIELLVVVAVIAAIAAMAFPLFGIIQRKTRANNARLLVETVLTTVVAQPQQRWETVTYDETSGKISRSTRKLFDWNDDGKIDGHYGKASSPDTVGGPPKDPDMPVDGGGRSIDAEYGGFLWITRAQIDHRWQKKVPVDGKQVSCGVVVDPWGNALRIDFDATKYGPIGVGVWSCGPDGKTSRDTGSAQDDADDITSWTSRD